MAKSNITVILFSLIISYSLVTQPFDRGCSERDRVWIRNHDLTVSYEPNILENTRRAINRKFTEAPLEIEFHDKDDGTFVYAEDNRDIPFTYEEVSRHRYRVWVNNEDQGTLLIRGMDQDSGFVYVKFRSGNIWIAYTIYD